MESEWLICIHQENYGVSSMFGFTDRLGVVALETVMGKWIFLTNCQKIVKGT
jgi:hypothetical protein